MWLTRQAKFLLAGAVAALLPPLAGAAAECGRPAACAAAGARWVPPSRLDWRLDYSDAFRSGRIDAGETEAFILPLHEVEAAEAEARTAGRPSPVADLRCGKGRRLVCYTNCGAYEPGHWSEELLAPSRDTLLGKTMAGYENERWLDVRRLDALRPLVRDKFGAAARLGCDALLCDNTEAWITGTDGKDGEAISLYRSEGIAAVERLAASRAESVTGFAIGYDDQLRFNRMLAAEAHAQCLAIGLINDVFQIGELAGDFDFALNEQCHHCGWCDLYKPFVAAGKPVLHLEFADNEGFCGPGSAPVSTICEATRKLGLSTFNTQKRQASSKLDRQDRPEMCPAR
jgi:hypothetical protein